ncbi:MAG: hypothetical protein IKU54_02540 [Oscillospiraceae bacterium]|nr:hypothetical protein [Oscillospiraceae bacterium]
MINKVDLFFENAELISEKLGIVPLLYGSLGLEYLTGYNLNADDIDILIPKIYVREKWPIFKSLLEENGYVLIDENEHEFVKYNICYAFSYIEDLQPFAGICIDEIPVLSKNNVQFRLLSLTQYLKVYTASSKDGYRINTREKKDIEKISFIKNLL